MVLYRLLFDHGCLADPFVVITAKKEKIREQFPQLKFNYKPNGWYRRTLVV